MFLTAAASVLDPWSSLLSSTLHSTWRWPSRVRISGNSQIITELQGYVLYMLMLMLNNKHRHNNINIQQYQHQQSPGRDAAK